MEIWRLCWRNGGAPFMVRLWYCKSPQRWELQLEGEKVPKRVQPTFWNEELGPRNERRRFLLKLQNLGVVQNGYCWQEVSCGNESTWWSRKRNVLDLFSIWECTAQLYSVEAYHGSRYMYSSIAYKVNLTYQGSSGLTKRKTWGLGNDRWWNF